MKYSFEIKLKAVKAIKKEILIIEPYNKICRQWRDRVKHWEKIYDKHGENGLKAFHGKSSKFHTYKGDNGNHKENLLLHSIVNNNKNKIQYIRNFKTNKPNQKWTTDVSEFKIASGNYIYLQYLICMIFQSGQGWQYQSIYYQNELKKRNIRQSFYRTGNYIDNSIMENFFGIMKKEMFYGYEKDFKTLDELKIAMIKYINYYNNKRINKKRKGLSPLEYRQQYLSLINKN